MEFLVFYIGARKRRFIQSFEGMFALDTPYGTDALDTPYGTVASFASVAGILMCLIFCVSHKSHEPSGHSGETLWSARCHDSCRIIKR